MTIYEIDCQTMMVNFFVKKVKKNLVVSFFCCIFALETMN